MKKWLAGKRFESNENIITKTEAYFEDRSKSMLKTMLKDMSKPTRNNVIFCVFIKTY